VNQYRAQWRRKHDALMLKKADVTRNHNGRVSGRRGTAYTPDGLSSLFSQSGRGTPLPGSSKWKKAARLSRTLRKFNAGLDSSNSPYEERQATIQEELPGQILEGNGTEGEGVGPHPQRQRTSLTARFDNGVPDEANSAPDDTPKPAAPGSTPRSFARSSAALSAAARMLRGRQSQDKAPETTSLADDGTSSDALSPSSTSDRASRFNSSGGGKGRGWDKLNEMHNPSTPSKPAANAIAAVDPILMARRYNFPVSEVKERLEEFKGLDREKRGVLSRAEFLEAVKRRLHIKDTNEIPQRMITEVWRVTDSDGSGEIDFEEFLAWTQTVAFSEDLMITDPADQKIRELARRHNMPITTVEYIWREYDRCDCPNGKMNRECFTQMVTALLHAKEASDLPKGRLFAFWQAADAKRAGFIDFDQFLSWYIKYFVPMGSPTLAVDSPASAVYAKLGTNRFASYLANFRLCEEMYSDEEQGAMKDAAAVWQSLAQTV